MSNYKCDFCDKTFRKKDSLKRHIKIVHEGVKNHKCDMCEKSFFTSSFLESHKTNFHLKNKCDICEKGFSTLRRLKRQG